LIIADTIGRHFDELRCHRVVPPLKLVKSSFLNLMWIIYLNYPKKHRDYRDITNLGVKKIKQVYITENRAGRGPCSLWNESITSIFGFKSLHSSSIYSLQPYIIITINITQHSPSLNFETVWYVILKYPWSSSVLFPPKNSKLVLFQWDFPKCNWDIPFHTSFQSLFNSSNDIGPL